MWLVEAAEADLAVRDFQVLRRRNVAAEAAEAAEADLHFIRNLGFFLLLFQPLTL
jgi:hypothetical protein